MAEFKKFTIEEDVELGYYPERSHLRDKTITLAVDDSDSPVAVGGNPTPTPRQSLETAIVKTLEFPTSAEFDDLFDRNNALREQGLQTLEDIPDITRRVKLRITVEVLED